MLDKDGMPEKEEIEIRIPAFRVVRVYDVSQTEGEPIQEPETKELLSSVEDYGESRNEVIEDIERALPYLEASYLTELSHRVISRHEAVSINDTGGFYGEKRKICKINVICD